jgi:predicted PurR-regulated permease PerM
VVSRFEPQSDLKHGVSRLVPKWVGVGLFIYLSIFALGYAQLFLVPILFAFLLSMVLAPIRRFFERCGLASSLAAGLIMTLLVAMVFAIAATLAVPATGLVNHANRIENKLEYKLHEASGPFSGFFRAKKKLKSMASDDSSKKQKVKVQNSGFVERISEMGPEIVGQIVFTLVLLLFLLASGDMFYEKLVHVMPRLSDKKRAANIVFNIERKLSHYLLTITVINLSLGIVVAVVMWLLDMPSPEMFGVIAFVFNFVPYLGAIAGIAIAAIVAFVSFSWPVWALVVAGAYFACTAVEGQFVTPYCVGRSLRLNTVVVFITISFWAWLWSAVGMIIAVPVLVTIKTFSEHIDGLEPLGDFLAERHSELDDS